GFSPGPASPERRFHWRSCGGFQRGARAPLCVVAEEGVTGEKPHRKGFSSRACFCLLFPRGKSRSGSGGETPATPGVRGRSPRKKECGAEGPTDLTRRKKSENTCSVAGGRARGRRSDGPEGDLLA